MLGHELAIEQRKASKAQPRDEPCQRNFRGVACAGNHALTEKGAAERNPVEAARQLAVDPAFDAVGEAQRVKVRVALLDRAVDPCGRPIRRGLRA